jgi:hypothetical protein
MSRLMTISVLVLSLTGAAAPAAEAGPDTPQPLARSRGVHGCFGTYNAAPRGQDGRVDLDRLLSDLAELRANTYHWLIWHAATDWDDLQRFLPLARDRRLNVWVSLVPPSESPPKTRRFSEPFKLDYERWAKEIATLSTKEPALVAWSIDDFAHNLGVFTPAQTRKLVAITRAINPRLAFVPCCYYRQVTPKFADQYRDLIDGVLFPYRNESVKPDLKSSGAVAAEVARIRLLMGPMPVIVDVYATRHSSLGDSTPAYVGEVMAAGGDNADGVLVYCHQDKARDAEKFEVIRRCFARWADRKAWKPATSAPANR